MIDTVDVVVIGDGPAGSALAAACGAVGVDALLVGADDPWNATYGAWDDDLGEVAVLGGRDVLASSHPDIVAWTNRRHDLGRAYGVIANEELRSLLRTSTAHVADRVDLVDRVDRAHHRVVLASGETIACRLVVDATGWPASFADAMVGDRAPAWQTAYGVVLPAPPPGDLGNPTFMDFRAVAGSPTSSQATFAYALPVADGWLVEETVLAARPAVAPDDLAGRLAQRLGMSVEELHGRAVRIEHVRIPMGGSRPRRDQPIVAFGAAAGYINPTSGYSVVHSLTAAPIVASAIASALGSTRLGADVSAVAAAVWPAVWPIEARRTRVLHDYGLDLLVRLDDVAVRAFFEVFFELPTPAWSAYLRAETPPIEVARVMRALFSVAPWSIRRRLLAGNPVAFARLLRPA